MSFSLSSGPSRQALRSFSTSSSSKAAMKASLLLSRVPLITTVPHPFAQAYYDRSMKIRHALSNPPPTQFYFKTGSLPHRRFQLAEHARELEYYGSKIAGPEPEVGGDVQPEPEVEVMARDEWAKADAGRGEASLERAPEEEIYLLVQEKGKWTFPSTEVKSGESLDEAVNSRVVGVDGALDGKTIDTWLVTKKPVGVVREGEQRNFFLRSHVLAGELNLKKESGYSKGAWLTAEEVEERLRKQGDEKLWETVQGMFGKGIEEEL